MMIYLVPVEVIGQINDFRSPLFVNVELYESARVEVVACHRRLSQRLSSRTVSEIGPPRMRIGLNLESRARLSDFLRSTTWSPHGMISIAEPSSTPHCRAIDLGMRTARLAPILEIFDFAFTRVPLPSTSVSCCVCAALGNIHLEEVSHFDTTSPQT